MVCGVVLLDKRVVSLGERVVRALLGKRTTKALSHDEDDLFSPSCGVCVVDTQGKPFQAKILVVDHKKRTYKIRAADGQTKVFKA
eukprot:CAMPEP_0171061886 /NCGR_PEP_ID=MMETSP0766_2-20121228/4729_1 /TAXON_ID=439317 /ORGANISM="Gambierdiscus australes, Strain CAWD 149" /LENGTH=84 /DNA_ID=CAMNT_0011517631 /DNA_START=168 /DNA_END=423 /DNA_ORIENTATION=-